MKKLIAFFAFAAIALGVAQSSLAAPKHEISLFRGVVATTGDSEWDIEFGYDYSITECFQLGGSVNFKEKNITGAVNSTQWDFFASFIYNFWGNDIRDSVWIRVAPGISRESLTLLGATTVAADTQFRLVASIGKKFKIHEHVSYRPYLGVSERFGDTNPTKFFVTPLAITVSF